MTKEQEEILQIFKSKKCILFCGAGISFASGIPTVFPLLKYLFQKFEIQQIDQEKYFEFHVPFEATIEVISEFVSISDFLNIFDLNQPNLNHRLIAQLLTSGLVNLVITTNFDENIEFALRQKGWKKGHDYKVITNLLSPIDFTLPTILKLHGTVSEKNSISTTIQKISSKALVNSVLEVLKAIFSNPNWETLFFWGYSFSDKFDVNVALSEINKNQKKSFEIQHHNLTTFSLTFQEQNLSTDFQNYKILSCNSDLIFPQIFNHFDSKHYQATFSHNWKKIIDTWHSNVINDKVLGNNAIIATNLFTHCGLYPLGIKYIQKAIESPAANKNYLIKGELVAKLAALHFKEGFDSVAKNSVDQKSFDHARKYYSDVLDLMKRNNDQYNFEIHSGNLAQTLLKIGLFQESESRLVEAIAYMENLLRDPSQPDILNIRKHYTGYLFALAACYRTEGKKLNEAKKYYDRSLELSKNFGHLNNIHLNLNGLGLLAYSQNNFIESSKNFVQSFEICKNLVLVDQYFYQFKMSCISLFKAYGYDKANEFYKKHFDFMSNLSSVPPLITIVSQNITIK